MKVWFLFAIIFLLLIMSGCGGYSYENGSWVYVSYDEGAGRRVEKLNADKETFSILENRNYAKDKNKVFYLGRIIDGADPKTFEVISDDGYSKDSNNVFINWYEFYNVSPQKFIYLGFPYSKDDKNVYCGTLPINVKNVNGFKVLERNNDKETTSFEYFLQENPDYPFKNIVPKDYTVIIGLGGKGQTQDQRFFSYKEVK